MDENHQDWANHKLVTTEDKIWLPPSYINNKPPSVPPVPKKRGINWGFAQKSFWEWLLFLGTLAIPFVVTILGLNFTQQQHQTDLQIAQDQQQATILQTYIANIQDLLLNHNLLKSKPDEDIAILARARTLTALQGLDPQRKGTLLQFLHEAQLIGTVDQKTGKGVARIIDLSYANLYGADLRGANLRRALLRGAQLSKAYLSYSKAYLSYTDLRSADLRGALLDSADLRGALLDSADLSGADLRSAKVTREQLAKASSLKGTTMPDGTTYP